MSELIPMENSIAGKIRAVLVPGFCNAIADKGVSLERRGAYFGPVMAEQLSAARQDQEGARQPWHSDQRANYWQSYMLEECVLPVRMQNVETSIPGCARPRLAGRGVGGCGSAGLSGDAIVMRPPGIELAMTAAAPGR